MPKPPVDTNAEPLGRPVRTVSPSGRPLFLERQIYRHRRLIDAAKWLPLAGLLLFVVPALLVGTPGPASQGGTTAVRLVYFFFVWLCLIAICAVIVNGLSKGEDLNRGPSEPQGPPEPAHDSGRPV